MASPATARERTAALWRFVRLHRRALGYASILLLATALRFTGLYFLPRVPWGRPDEEIFVQVGLRLFAENNPHVAETGWPELWFRVHHLAQVAMRGWWSLTHGGQDPNLGCVFALAPARLVMPLRVLAATLGVLTVALTMRFAFLATPRWMGPHERHAVALAGGLFYAVDVLAMRDSHFAVSDQALMFFFAWMLVAMARGVERGHPIDFLSCGLALGLAIGTKWTGLTFAILPVLALGRRWLRFGPSPGNFAAILLGVGGAVGAFLITNPTFLSDSTPFFDGIRSVSMRYDPNVPRAFSIYADAPLELSGIRHLTVSLPFALGWPLTLTAYAGTLFLATRVRRGHGLMAFVVGAWSLLFLALIGRASLYFARYALPVHPTMCVAAAMLLVMGTREAAERWSKREGRLRTVGVWLEAHAGRVVLALTLVLAMEPTLRAVELDSMLLVPETRERAMSWLRVHAGDEAIDYVGDYSRPFGVDDRIADRCAAVLPSDLGGWVPRLQVDEDLSRMVTAPPGTWYPLASELVMASRSHRPSRITAEWVVVARPFLPCGQATNPFFSHPPPRCYVEAARFEPEGIECDAMWDDQDHFYAPLWGYTRPWSLSGPDAARWGPSIVVYRSECEGR